MASVEVPSAADWAAAQDLLAQRLQELKEMVGHLTPQDRPPPIDFTPVLEALKAQNATMAEVMGLIAELKAKVDANTEEVIVAFQDFVDAVVKHPPSGGGTGSWFVDPTGSDTNDGTTSATPFLTIQKALDSVSPGQTIVVAAGTYTENLIYKSNGAAASPVTLQANGAVIINGRIQPTTFDDNTNDPTLNPNKYLILKGFTFQGATTKTIRASTGWLIDGCTIKNAAFGINIRGNDVVVQNCTIQDIAGTDAHAFVGVGGSGIKILNNQVHRVNKDDQTDAGNSAVNKFLSTSGLEIAGNLFDDCHGPGMWLDTANDAFNIHDNTFQNMVSPVGLEQGPGLFIEVNGDTGGSFIQNNEFINNQTAGLYIAESAQITVSGNIFSGQTTRDIWFKNQDRLADGSDAGGAGLGNTYCHDITVFDNTFSAPKACEVHSGSTVTIVGNNPYDWGVAPTANIKFDHNTYGTFHLSWIDPTTHSNIEYTDLATLQSAISWETNPVGTGTGSSFPAIGSSFITPSNTHMTLKHSDEFVGVFDADLGKNYIDKSKWITTFWQGSTERTLGGNGEAQYYMDPDYAGQSAGYKARNQRPNPFEFTADPSGVLKIKAFPVASADWANWWMGIQRPFCSGILNSMPDIHTGQPFSPTNRTSVAPRKGWLFQYGYVEIRAKLPKHFGSWPAFWFLHDDTLDGFNFASAESDYFGRVNEVVSKHGWPPEYDRIESFGHRPFAIHDGYVTVSSTDSGFGFGGWRDTPNGFDISADFHTYGVEINSSSIIENVDGVVTNTFNTPPSWKVANRRWYTMLNLAVGGNWYAGEINSGAFGTDSIQDANGVVPAAGQCKAWTVDVPGMPWEFVIDYIRWYEP